MRIMIILLSLLVLAACAPSQDQLRRDMDLEELKRRLAQLEVRQAEAVTSGTSSGESAQRQVAELQAGLDNLRVESQSINGRLDDLSQDNRQLSDELQLVKDDFGLQLSSLMSRVDEQEQQLVQLATTPPVTPVEKSPPPAEETPEQLYQRGLDMIRGGRNFSEGRQVLEQFAAKYPRHGLYVNALYWSGEALYGEKKYELAILQLQDVISKFPQHSKAAAAMLKQALAFNALGDRGNARTTMQKLIEDYPDSAQVKAAKKYLEN